MPDPVADPTAGSGGVGDPTPPPAAPPAAPPPVMPPVPPAALPVDPTAAPSAVDDGDKPISRSAMLERVDRAKRSAATDAQKQHEAWLQEHFGTTDLTKIAEQQAASAKLQEEAEKQKRAEMSELERARTDLANEMTRREAAETQTAKLQQQQLADRTGAKVRSIATQHVDDDSADFVSWKYARHVAGLPNAEREAIDEKAVNKWFAKFVKDNPKHSRTPPALLPAKKKITTGVAPSKGRPPPVPGAATGKTPRPGQPNSMSKAEYAAYKREKGLTY